jgi:hypothetical protein
MPNTLAFAQANFPFSGQLRRAAWQASTLKITKTSAKRSKKRIICPTTMSGRAGGSYSSPAHCERAAPLRTSKSASALVAPNMRSYEGLTRRPSAQNEADKSFRSLVALVKTDTSIVIP